MKQTFGKRLRAAALTTLWSVSATGIAQPAKAQVFNPKYNSTMTVLKEIAENCSMMDAELAQSMLDHMNEFLKEAEAKGITDIRTEPFTYENIHQGIIDSLRHWGSIDLDIGKGPDVRKGPRFVCQIS